MSAREQGNVKKENKKKRGKTRKKKRDIGAVRV
jgi:hypothetical protein